jgi:hypothetical protein
MIEVSYKRTADKIIDGQRHFLRQHPKRLLPRVVWSLVLTAIVCLELYRGERVNAGCLILGGLFVMITAPIWRDLGTRHFFKPSPFFDEDTTIRFDEVGYHATSEQSDSKVAWSAFTDAVEFSDGFLLFTGPNIYYWIPANTIVKPDQIPEFKNLLRAKVGKYRTIDGASH